MLARLGFMPHIFINANFKKLNSQRDSETLRYRG
ncbi:hypothetical protein X564_08370 [Pseudoalteromonas agarivorans]|nr:hypothetical protein X564_08370 [Pseudoalteromonas agarivorans]